MATKRQELHAKDSGIMSKLVSWRHDPHIAREEFLEMRAWCVDEEATRPAELCRHMDERRTYFR